MRLIKKIQEIGLSKREAEVYIALLQKNKFTAPELTKITTVIRTKIYEILQSLIHKGMCDVVNNNGQKIYRAVKPNIVLQNTISNIDLEIEQQKKIVIERERKATIDLEKMIVIEQKKVVALEQKKVAAVTLEKELVSLYENNQRNDESLDYIEVITDVRAIKERWIEILKNTKHELVIFTKPPYSISFEDNLEYESSLIKKKKISFKSLYEYNSINTTEEMSKFIQFLDEYEKVGEDIRIVKELPMKLAISDDKTTMLALNDRISLKSSITTMIVNHPSFATSLKSSFESFWTKGITLYDFKKDIDKYINNRL